MSGDDALGLEQVEGIRGVVAEEKGRCRPQADREDRSLELSSKCLGTRLKIFLQFYFLAT